MDGLSHNLGTIGDTAEKDPCIKSNTLARFVARTLHVRQRGGFTLISEDAQLPIMMPMAYLLEGSEICESSSEIIEKDLYKLCIHYWTNSVLYPSVQLWRSGAFDQWLMTSSMYNYICEVFLYFRRMVGILLVPRYSPVRYSVTILKKGADCDGDPWSMYGLDCADHRNMPGYQIWKLFVDHVRNATTAAHSLP